MKHYYTIEQFNGVIVADALTKKDAIRTARERALDFRQSLTIHKVDKETRKILEYVGIAEFPVWMRNFDREKLDIHDTTFVGI